MSNLMVPGHMSAARSVVVHEFKVANVSAQRNETLHAGSTPGHEIFEDGFPGAHHELVFR